MFAGHVQSTAAWYTRKRPLRLVRTAVLMTAVATCLSPRIAFPQVPSSDQVQAPREHIASLRAKFLERIEKDKQKYGPEAVDKIEATYQLGNGNLRSPEGREALKKVIAQWPDSNRAGCACCYLGQFESGPESVKYFRLAIEKYADCLWGSGAQVGAMARFFWIPRLRESGHAAEADKLETELRTMFPDAVNHGRYYLQPGTAKDAARSAARSTLYAAPVKMDLVNSIGMKFVLIRAGEFEMGSTDETIAQATAEAKKANWVGAYFERLARETPRHRVKITRPFYLGVHEVTQGEYQQVMGVNPSTFAPKQLDGSSFKPPLTGKPQEYRKLQAQKVAGMDTSRHPVEMVSWEDAVAFCRKLSAQPSERAAGRAYRLPTEAEWEYACRAGSTTRWCCGDDEAALGDYAWMPTNSDLRTHPVGQKKANVWGLYDMHGNLSEWCADWFEQNYYRQSPGTDPSGPTSGFARVVRGGAWRSYPRNCCSAFCGLLRPTSRTSDVGFRVAVTTSPGPR